MRSYIQAVLHTRWLLDAVEAQLETIPDTNSINLQNVLPLNGGRLATQNEMAILMAALLDIGVFLPGLPLHFSKKALDEATGYRRGVRDMLDNLPKQDDSIQLCAALPSNVLPALESTLHEETLDLRSALFNLFASAQTRIVVASPFWDNVTIHDLIELFEKRLNSGVLIDVLGRPDGRSGNEYLAFSKYFAYQPGIQFFNWYQPSVEDPFRSQTFHFKAAIVDNGAKAYLGSANMTVSGLRSRMELGVILEGRSAKNLSKVLDSVLSIASKV